MKSKKVFLLAIAMMTGCGTGAYAQKQANDKKVKAYMVADAHLDTQWNWDIQTTINEYVWNTINRNLFLMKRYPNYVFNFEGAVKYSWMKEYYPTQYEELKEYINSGRWHISGSGWDANDVLVPSSESVIRNIMLGQTYYRQEFGKESTDIFLPDCFGFGWTLPSLAAHCGLIGFSSQKLDWRNNPFYGNSKHPFTIGLWKGVDGKQLMLAHGYDYGRRWNDEDLSESEQLQKLSKDNPFGLVYRYYGTGDTGGSPTLESVRSIEKGIKGDGPVEVISATSDQLYKDFQPYDKHPELPVFNGELLMDVHGTGCYTSQAAMKLYNRQNELLGDAAERAALAAEWLGAADYPGASLTESWKRFIFHQFHDDLTGTSIPRAYEFSWNDELLSLKQFSDILTKAVDGVAGQLDTRTKGEAVVLYNANAFPVTDLAEIVIETSKTPKGYTVYNEKGKKVPSQLVGYAGGKAHLLVEATVPANGYVVYDVRTSGGKAAVEPTEVSSIENSVYKLTFDQNGDIVSLQDKRNGKEMVKEGQAIRLALFTENKSYAWPAWEILKETVDRDPISITDDVKIRLVEDGTLRKAVCIEKKYGESVFKQYVRLYEGCRADRVDFYNEVDWQTTNALLKAEFPLAIENEKATYDLGLGNIQRGNNTKTAYEVYAHQWTDLTDQSNSYGVSVLNDCKYGWDKPNNHTIRLSLLHTPKTDGGYTYQNRQDFGHHIFTYSLTGHEGALDKSATVQKAAVLNQPLKAFISPKHKGTLGKSFSFAQSDNDKVIIKALKKAEVSDEYVVRVYETEGKELQKAVITFAGEIESACEADGTEKEIGTATFNGNGLQVSVEPYSVKTYKVRLKKATPVQSVDYAYLPLKYDRKCFSWNEFRHEANFESGYSYAAELLPDSVLTANGVPFRLGEKEIANGVTCKGNEIELPANSSYNRIYFLVASTDKDRTVTLGIGEKQEEVTVPYYTDFIGQWGHVGHTEGFLKQAEVAYVGTHRHSAEKDEAYEFTYMFKVGMDIPKDAKSIKLPEDEHVVVFAATLVDEQYPSVVPAGELFRTAIMEGKSTNNRANLLKDAKIIGCSGEVNESEQARFAIDGNTSTKWCDTSVAPNYIDFDLGEQKELTGWKLVNAGQEGSSFITGACFLQGRNDLNEEWKTIDPLVGNRKDTVLRNFNKVSYRYVRLLITQSTQDNGLNAARIYEIEVY